MISEILCFDFHLFLPVFSYLAFTTQSDFVQLYRKFVGIYTMNLTGGSERMLNLEKNIQRFLDMKFSDCVSICV